MMTTVKSVLDFLNTIAPQELAMDWDNPGLQAGSPGACVRRILVALDPFEDVCREAAQWGADMIVTHHPLIFHPLKNVTDETPVGRCLRLLLKNDISLWSGHTNLDVAPGGVNDVLAQTLGLQNIQSIPPENLLRWGLVPQQSLTDILSMVKSKLGCTYLRYTDGEKPCHRIAVGGGACASEMRWALDSGCDTFVTADVKYNQFWDAADCGLNIIDAGHFYTENPVCSMLCAALQQAFPDLEVRSSQIHRDCMKFF